MVNVAVRNVSRVWGNCSAVDWWPASSLIQHKYSVLGLTFVYMSTTKIPIAYNFTQMEDRFLWRVRRVVYRWPESVKYYDINPCSFGRPVHKRFLL